MIEVDSHIIKSCIKGERKAQMQLYTALYKRVYNSCLRILRDRQEAEDAMQESFIKAFSHLEKYDGALSFEAWMVRIAINTSIDKLRGKNLEWVDCGDTLLYNLEDKDDKEDWEQILARVEEVKSAINRLPEANRLILSLYLIEGYDHKEIAEILNIQAGASRVQYMRAKQKLIELLKE